MKYLFFLAHPDDEAVAAGGTIRLLAKQGNEVIVVLATAGDQATRLKEFKNSCQILGVSQYEILGYKDGEINNKLVWGELEQKFVEMIDKYQPEVVVTFDHSGWYFHLDHVGVSLAALRAARKAEHKAQGLLFSLFHPPGTKIKWPYVYQLPLPATHVVEVKSVIKDKIKAIKAHKSQHFGFLPSMVLGLMDKEYFQLVLGTKKSKIWLDKSVFKKI